ncbi:MAG: hypothetical protein ACRD9R_19955 [Pyrinomonadaceae bacterium]
MALPISDDLRERIIRFYENHDDDAQPEIADEFGVSQSFVEKPPAPVAYHRQQRGLAARGRTHPHFAPLRHHGA